MAGRGSVPVFVNVAAGRSGYRPERPVARAFRRGGVNAVVRPVSPDRMAAEVRQASDRGARVVCVAGGDGTMRTAAGALTGRSTALVPLPTGTLNHFARRLGLGGADAAVRAVRDGRVVPVPVGTVNGRIFLCSASCGFYAEIVRKRERLRPWLTKWPAASAALASTVARLPLLHVDIELEGAGLAVSTPLVVVGVGRDSVPFPHEVRHAAPAEMLEVVVWRVRTRRELAWSAAAALARITRGRSLGPDRHIQVAHVSRFGMAAAGRVDVTLDGEPVRLDAPLEFAIRPAGLRVLLPPEVCGP